MWGKTAKEIWHKGRKWKRQRKWKNNHFPHWYQMIFVIKDKKFSVNLGKVDKNIYWIWTIWNGQNKRGRTDIGVNAYLISTTLEFLTCIDWICSYMVLVHSCVHCKQHWKWTHNNQANTTHIIICFPFSSLKMPCNLPLIKKDEFLDGISFILSDFIKLFFMQQIKIFPQYSQMLGFHFFDQFLITLGNWIDLFSMTWLIFWL